MNLRTAGFFLIWLFSLPTAVICADWRDRIDGLLSESTPPSGVVFEIATGDADRLDSLLPAIRDHSARLREQFPGLSIAVVSHGAEQFALMSGKSDWYRKTHEAARRLSTLDDIPVHVCGTHAAWYAVTPEEYPDYVDVAPVGPAQVTQYQEMGFVVIAVE